MQLILANLKKTTQNNNDKLSIKKEIDDADKKIIDTSETVKYWL